MLPKVPKVASQLLTLSVIHLTTKAQLLLTKEATLTTTHQQ
jgi:hypothetical protein